MCGLTLHGDKQKFTFHHLCTQEDELLSIFPFKIIFYEAILSDSPPSSCD
jgi:hypothetical protein